MNSTGAAAAADFDTLYRELHPSLYRYLERLTGDRDVAEDLAQEAFVRLLTRPDLGGDSARLWLFTVGTNLARDRGRSISRRARILSAEPLAPPANPTPEEELERRERVGAVREALGRLSERDRQMLLMREEGFRYAEIAQAVGVAPGSVGTLVARALRRFVQEYGTETKG